MDSRNSKYEALFRDSSVWRSIFSLALPSLLTIVVMIFYNMADLFFIAQLRDTAKVAAVSIVMISRATWALSFGQRADEYDEWITGEHAAVRLMELRQEALARFKD